MNTKFGPVFIILLTSCSKGIHTPFIEIGATTSLIGTILQEIGKERVDVVTIVPAEMCPGHFDVKPEAIKDLYDAKAILSHEVESWIEKLLSTGDNRKLVIKPLKTKGNWMIPEVQKFAAKEITEILVEITPENRNFYENNLSAYETLIDSVVGEISGVMSIFKSVKVICSEHQREFLAWLGFNIIATYRRPEELTPKELLKIIRIGKKKKVQMVVDNLQSGGASGKEIAEEIGASYVVLTNFPLGNAYITSLKKNIDKLTEALNE